METRWRDGLLDVLTVHGQVRYAGPGVVYGEHAKRWRPRTLATVGGGSGALSASRPPLSLRWDVEIVGDAKRATVSVRNEWSQPLALWSLEPLVVDDDGDLALNGPTAGWSLFTNGFQSWSGTRS